MIGAVQDLFGVVKTRVELPREGRAGTDAVRLAVRLAEELRAATDRPLLGVGVGTPGVVDARGVVLDAPSLSWRERTMAVSTADFVVRTSTLGDDVVLAGAAVLVLSGELGVA